MLENISGVMNLTSKVEIDFINTSKGAIANIVASLIENGRQEEIFNEIFECKNIYDCFCKLEGTFDGYVDYKKFRESLCGLNAIDEMHLTNYGDCTAISRAKRLVYKERYCDHTNLQNYFEELHNQITTMQDYLKPIEKISREML